jgi:hypothetical protein
MSGERRFYVYIWFRNNGVPCYVGKGQGGRWKDHVKSARNPHLANIFAKANSDMPVVIVREGLTEEQAFETEVALIKAIGRKIDKGPLVNLTDGGDGVSGLVHSDHTRKLVGDISRAMWEDPGTRAKIIAAQALGKSDAEFRAMRSAASKLTWADDDLRAKLSATQRARLADPGKRLAVSVATKAAMANPEIRARVSAAQKARFERPDERAKQGRTRGRSATPEQLAARKAGLARPEVRQKMSEAAKARLARRNATKLGD